MLVKCIDLILHFLCFSIKLILVLFHDVDKLVLLFVEIVALLLDFLHGVTWRAEESPLSVIVFVLAELVEELFEDVIDLHTGSNLVLELGNLAGSTSHLLFDSRKVLDVLGGGLDGEVQSVECVHCTICHDLSLLGNKLNDLSSDFLVLRSNDVSDAAAVDAEHGHYAAILDFIPQLFGLLDVLDDQFFELNGLGLIFLIRQGSDLLLRVKLVLILVDLESLKVLLERLDTFIDFLHQAMVLLVDPSVLIGKGFFVGFIRSFRHLFGLNWHFKMHFLVALEEVRHQFLLKLRNFLESDEAIFECVTNGRDHC